MGCSSPVSQRLHSTVFPSQFATGIGLATVFEKGTMPMTKSLDSLTEIVRNQKHPFRKTDDQPAKPQKHRYERRKIRSFLRLGAWGEEQAAV